MKFFQLIFTFCLSSFFLSAQDAYHTNLANMLSSDYGLPNGEWVLGNTELGIYNSVANWNSSESVIGVMGQDFMNVSQVTINQGSTNPWDSGWKLDNTVAVQDEDKVLMVLWLRTTSGTGKVNIFAERATDFSKEVYLSANINEDWKQYFIPFSANGNYSVNQLSFGFHLALQGQTIQVGGFTVINFKNAVQLDDLPTDLHNDEYDGFEPDAPWRAAAANRIENLRKANLTIVAENTDGTPVPSASVAIEMTRHEYAFGTAITASRIAGNNDQNIFYENKLNNLDGEGHGFNWVVFENDLKWDGWEEEWYVNHDELVNAVAWLNDHDIQVRGHCLAWPGWDFLPDDIQPNANDADYVWNRVEGRLDEMLNYPGLAGNIPEWDVLNEIVVNNVFQPIFQNEPGFVTGREVYADIFKRVRALDPNVKLYLNDYVTLSLNNTGGGQYDVLKSRIQELLDADAPIDGIGFQAHIGTFPNGIPSVLTTLDDFYDSFGLTAKITEFDLPAAVSEELGAKYLGDFLTATFSHESTDGFLFWSFWDGATYMNPGANLFRDNWSRTPAGELFNDLVFNQWWTDTLAVTDENGVATMRCFKGLHRLTYVCNGETITEMVNLSEDQDLTIICDNLQTNVDPLETATFSFKVAPNPADNYLRIEQKEAMKTTATLYNAIGEKVMEQTIADRINTLPVDQLRGIYFLELRNEHERAFQKVVIE